MALGLRRTATAPTATSAVAHGSNHDGRPRISATSLRLNSGWVRRNTVVADVTQVGQAADKRRQRAHCEDQGDRSQDEDDIEGQHVSIANRHPHGPDEEQREHDLNRDGHRVGHQRATNTDAIAAPVGAQRTGRVRSGSGRSPIDGAGRRAGSLVRGRPQGPELVAFGPRLDAFRDQATALRRAKYTIPATRAWRISSVSISRTRPMSNFT